MIAGAVVPPTTLNRIARSKHLDRAGDDHSRCGRRSKKLVEQDPLRVDIGSEVMLATSPLRVLLACARQPRVVAASEKPPTFLADCPTGGHRTREHAPTAMLLSEERLSEIREKGLRCWRRAGLGARVPALKDIQGAVVWTVVEVSENEVGNRCKIGGVSPLSQRRNQSDRLPQAPWVGPEPPSVSRRRMNNIEIEPRAGLLMFETEQEDVAVVRKQRILTVRKHHARAWSIPVGLARPPAGPATQGHCQILALRVVWHDAAIPRRRTTWQDPLERSSVRNLLKSNDICVQQPQHALNAFAPLRSDITV